MQIIKWKNNTILAVLDNEDVQVAGFSADALACLRDKVKKFNDESLEEWGCNCRKVTLGKGCIVKGAAKDAFYSTVDESQLEEEGLFLTGDLRFWEVLHILPEEDKWLLRCYQEGIESWSFKGKPEMIADMVYTWYIRDTPTPVVGENTLKPAKPGDAGVDLKAVNACDVYPCGKEDFLPDVGLNEFELQAKSNNVTIVHTKLHVAIPEGYMGIIVSRSGVALKYGVQVINTPGIIDSGYRGEIMIGLVNHGNEVYHINKDDRVAQLILVPIKVPCFINVDTLGKTERGAGGFGSTGIK